MTFKAYGADQLRAAIENDCLLARYAMDTINASQDFELLAPVPLSIVCFRYVGTGSYSSPELDEINNRLLRLIEEDGRVFFAGTKIKGQTSLRINLTNHRRTTKDIDYLFNVLRELGSKAMAEIAS
jgi:glutamate/tyrosine decarboxylase-like PLP-dependent enzyme